MGRLEVVSVGYFFAMAAEHGCWHMRARADAAA
jgi:hypothetical protein